MRTPEPAAVQSGDASSDRATRGSAMLRLSIPLARVLLAAIALCTALAYVLAREADDHLEAEPGGGRELQPMLDGKGRILGWFSWEAERPTTAMLVSLLPFLTGIALG